MRKRISSVLGKIAGLGILAVVIALNCYLDEKPTPSDNTQSNSQAFLSLIELRDSNNTIIPITPDFNPDTVKYAANLDFYGTIRLSFNSMGNYNSSTVKLDSKPVYMDQGYFPCVLRVNESVKTFQITIYDWNMVPRLYTLAISATPSSNDTLTDIRVHYTPSNMLLRTLPPFDRDSLSYGVSSPYYGAHAISVNRADSGATIEARIDGRSISTSWFGFGYSYPCTLTTGAKAKTCSLIVTAADGMTKRVYAVTIRREPALTGLVALANQANSLNPGFTPAIHAYDFIMPVCVDTLTLEPTCGTGDEIRINNALILSGQIQKIWISPTVDSTLVRLMVRERTSTDSSRYTVRVTRDPWSRVDSVTGFASGRRTRTAGQKLYVPVSLGADQFLNAFDGASVARVCTLSNITADASEIFAVDSGRAFYFVSCYYLGLGVNRNRLFRRNMASMDTVSDSLPGNLQIKDMMFDATHRLHVLCYNTATASLCVRRLSGTGWIDEGTISNSTAAASPGLQYYPGALFVSFINNSNAGVVHTLSASIYGDNSWHLSDYTDFPINKQFLASDGSSLFWAFSQDSAMVKKFAGSSWTVVYADTAIRSVSAMAVSGGSPWLLGQSRYSSGVLRVLKLTGTSWDQLGMDDFLGGLPAELIAVLNGNTYVGYLKGASQLELLTY